MFVIAVTQFSVVLLFGFLSSLAGNRQYTVFCLYNFLNCAALVAVQYPTISGFVPVLAYEVIRPLRLYTHGPHRKGTPKPSCFYEGLGVVLFLRCSTKL